MSNHITAAHTELVKLKYKNGIETIIPCIHFNISYTKECINNAIEEYKKELALKTEEDPFCDEIGIVWHIDFECNYNLNVAQLFIKTNDEIETILIPYDYDLGENETIEGVYAKTGIYCKKN